jgi:hypothetical protein
MSCSIASYSISAIVKLVAKNNPVLFDDGNTTKQDLMLIDFHFAFSLSFL